RSDPSRPATSYRFRDVGRGGRPGHARLRSRPLACPRGGWNPAIGGRRASRPVRRNRCGRGSACALRSDDTEARSGLPLALWRPDWLSCRRTLFAAGRLSPSTRERLLSYVDAEGSELAPHLMTAGGEDVGALFKDWIEYIQMRQYFVNSDPRS